MRVRYLSNKRWKNALARETKKERFSKIVADIIRESDIVLEVLDSRFINETRNHELENTIKRAGKKLIYVLNKSDLVDIKKAKERLPESLFPYVFISCKNRRGVKDLKKRIWIEIKGIKPKEEMNQIGVIGYPNTGKSSLINSLAGRKSARTSKESGFTKGIQKIRLSNRLMLIDTPGIISDREYRIDSALRKEKLAKIGARSVEKIKNPEVTVYELTKQYPGVIERFYGFEEAIEFQDFIEKLGRKKNFLLKGARIDEDRTCRMIIKDWQEGKNKGVI